MTYVTLCIGILLLFFCSDYLVRGSVAMAIKFEIPPIIIGLTIVAFGTSAPELVISLRSALIGSTGLAIGNVVGSNIANIFLVLGLPALICATDCKQPLVKRNSLFVIGSSLIFIALCNLGPLTLWHGIILLTLMTGFLIETAFWASQSLEKTTIGIETKELIGGISDLLGRNLLIAVYMIFGLIGLPVAAHLTVTSGVQIARDFGVSETTIGLTLVAFGTSLPELATTLAAALRGQSGLALGNVLGSNLFNILAIMGLVTLVAPINVPDVILNIDLWIMMAAALAIVPFIFFNVKMTRLSGLAFVGFYLLYIFNVLVQRQSGLDVAVLSSF
jgi:cation:H+ antiporter